MNTEPTKSTDGETLIQDEGQRSAAKDLSLQPQQVPKVPLGYDVVRCLGTGSFGAVWLGRELNTGRPVAIKFFNRRRGLDWALLTREVEKLAVLDASRDVVRLLDVGWDHDPPYFVMEYLESGSVAARLAEGPITTKEAVQIAKAVARALIHAHGAGILHCDIKPANVLLDRTNHARLADFGQSRLATEQSPALGTLFYMAPEQASLEGVPDVRWDVYALGVLLYQMVTGEVPYRTPAADARLDEAETLKDRLAEYRRLVEASPLPTAHRNAQKVDSNLADIIDGCLARDPKERHSNAQVVLDLLERRDVNRARRPLIWAGFLGPVLFLLTLLWGAGIAIPRAVDQAEQHLYERALASDAAAVNILAGSIQQDVDSRLRGLEELAERIQPLLANGDDPQPMLQAWADQQQDMLAEQSRTPDESIFLTDARGFQVFRSPHGDSVGKYWTFRDYFHGLGEDLDPNSDLSEIKPRRTTGISVAFRSKVTGQYMVALATPVWNEDHTEPIGVLARTLHLTDLLLQWEERIRETVEPNDTEEDFFLSLVDVREDPPLLLDHQWMTAEHLRPMTDDATLKQRLQLKQDAFNRFRQQKTDPDYIDPLAEVDSEFKGIWLAACADVGETGWVAVVQERRSRAVAPMSELYLLFFKYGAWMAVVFTAMLLLLWWVIRKMMHDS
ncbi:MAG: serine/threonine protein kinase [Planctomycetaceae bacterium]|nr:serine/threonine protein kinase [Planctomycetaceae bacterium]